MSFIQTILTLLANNSGAGPDGDAYTPYTPKGCCRRLEIIEIPPAGFAGGPYNGEGMTYKLGSDNFANVVPFPFVLGAPSLVIEDEVPDHAGHGRPLGFPQTGVVGGANSRPADIIIKLASASQNVTRVLIKEYS